MSGGLYTDFFGFSERPFTLLPDPEMMFWSPLYQRAYSVLEYGLFTHAPITVVTGEVGTGKTTLIQVLLSRLNSHDTVGLLSNVQGGRGDLLRWVLNALDVPVPDGADYVSLFQILQDFVLGEYAAGRHVILIIDEAQNLGTDLLEELRMLTNINSGKDTLLQLVLLGQPELRDMISQPSMRQFAQRITASFHINPMDETTTRNYIAARLQNVGGSGEEFSPSFVQKIYTMSTGIPRLINKLCDLALVYAASAQVNPVTETILLELIEDGLIGPELMPPLLLTNPVSTPKSVAP